MASTHPNPPTIVVNTPGAASSTISAPRTAPNKPSPLNTATEAQSQPTRSCYLCDEQNPGDFSPTTKYLDTCLLCSRHFCPIHRSSSWGQVCKINHATYYRERLAQAHSGTHAGETEAAETLVAEGVYPSLGEREKAIFASSPVTDGE